jgi:HPt (histidine-containing phosphotransfer) domain-containing protein
VNFRSTTGHRQVGSRLASGDRGSVEDNDKILDSPSNPRPQDDREWIQLTSKYLNDLPQQLDGIRTTLAVKDYAAIKKQAHRIKGTSATYRLERISQSVAELERLADSQNAEAIVSLIDKVRHLVDLEVKRLNSSPLSPPDGSERNSDG